MSMPLAMGSGKFSTESVDVGAVPAFDGAWPIER